MTAKSAVVDAAPQARMSGLALKYSLHLLFLGVVLAFSLALPKTFPTLINAQTIASTNAVLALLALGAIPTLVAGQFDLSIGFQLALAQSLCAGLIIYAGLPPLVAVALTLAAGLTLGAINGWLVAYCGLNAFITTLATGIVIQGATQWYTDGASIFGAIPGAFLGFGRATLLGVPLPCIYVIFAGCVLWFAYEHTSWGRRTFAIGGNARAAELIGIPTQRMTLQAFMLGSLLSALAGVLSTAILGSANPNIGVNFLLPAFAAVFLGAAPLGPGRFNSWGTIFAVYTLAAVIAGLQQLGAAFYVEQLFNDGALL
ncbi:MAG: ABC transporter permease, partial [Alphaproteobacteria bacterium]|nr:ABC transporter permease [Alphaproteobacteria bacterium]